MVSSFPTLTCIYKLVLFSILIATSTFVSAQFRIDAAGTAVQPVLPEVFGGKGKGGCCDGQLKPDEQGGFGLAAPQYGSYGVWATYYSLNGGLTTTLMLNNKGPQPILATPTFYSLSGTKLTLAPITVPAASYIDVNMHDLLAEAGDEFREGSMKIAYQGGDYQLGAQVKMVDQQNKLIWAEQMVYKTKFVSSRLESVWWLPDEDSQVRLVVANTSYSPVTVTLAVDGTSPQQSAPVQITLARSETRVLDIMTDLVGAPNGSLDTKGGVSIVHTGNSGAVLARMFVAKPNRGYSAAVPFVDPENTASQKWHGGGLRLRNLNSQALKPVLVARNTTNQMTRIRGRIPYTRPDGEVGFINIPNAPLPANSTRVVNLQGRIASAHLPASVTFAGIELEYDAPKGTVITQVQSVSPDGNHVFEVPMMDPEKMPSSAGGFPWKADGDFRTLVYIKNETAAARKFTAFLTWPGGVYATGLTEVKANQTTMIDFRDLRDGQTPDGMGNLIPLYLESAQIAWSISGAENNTLSARSEQISIVEGMASTYSCANCCPNVITDVYVHPEEVEVEFGDITTFFGTQYESNCYNQSFGPLTAETIEWESFDTSIATIEPDGDSVAVDVGATNIQGCLERTIWYNWGGGYCEPSVALMCNTAPVEVRPRVTINVPSSANDGSTVTSTSTVTGGTPTGYQWSFTTPSGSGNSPDLEFTSPTSSTTNAKAKWFASPNHACDAQLDSTYTVKLVVTFSNRDPINKSKSFKIVLPEEGGKTTGTATFGGDFIASLNGSGQYYPSSQHTFSIVRPPPTIVYNIQLGSQFREKVEAHENVHKDHWQPQSLYGAFFTDAGLWNAVKNETASTTAELGQKVFIKASSYIAAQIALIKSSGTCNQSEIAAYAVSDPMTPQFAYQRCGRTTWPACQ